MGRASKDKRDIYYRKAKEEGFRARSAYKLLQIHEEFNILDPAHITSAVDLCAAPGSWSQVLASLLHNKDKRQTIGYAANNQATCEADGVEHDITSTPSQSPAASALPPRIVAVDLQEMAPIAGVTFVQGDITEEKTAREVIRLLNCDLESNNRKEEEEVNVRREHGVCGTEQAHVAQTHTPLRMADIVVCDGAPDVTGMHELDEYLQHHLLLAALHIASCVLRKGGTFVTKMFRGPATPFLLAKAELFFRQVRLVKPFSSRNASMECFLLGQDFALPPGYVPRFATRSSTTNDTKASNNTEVVSSEAKKQEEEEEDAECGASSMAGLQVSNYAPEAPLYTYSTQDKTHTADDHVKDTCGAREAERVLLPFLACGDLSGFDADMCYDRAAHAAVLPPVHPPLQAPYLPPAVDERKTTKEEKVVEEEEEGDEEGSSDGNDDGQRKKPRVV